ncbi:unnamed protein product [Rotaria sp. Silwood2]|nr:unnamed protein product [Rotaria sp. Silwood2]CAF2994287.1 unnamed protein product [Rotaria sp. Silwood2]CAF3352783.1 unnamed protein product [Rotaria sp. Silwood2]CAF4074717.1 unnamed protein product [Rotaria sp. Silwood2]CAF4198393.1 unnamed protein product [Rotaria sp. Silwood2]
MANQINNEEDLRENIIYSSDDEEEEEIDNRRFPIDEDNEDDKWSSPSNNELSHHHLEPQCLKNVDWNDLNDFICSMNEEHVDEDEHKHIRIEKGRLLLLRSKLMEDNMILRATYKGTGFHLCPVDIFQQKSSDFMLRTGAYSLIQELNVENQNMSQECLANIVNRVETTLNDLLHSKSITNIQYANMNTNRLLVRLNYLYFVPETHKVCLFILIHTLELYQQSKHLQPTTLFASFNIDELCTMFSHQQAIEALKFVLDYHAFDHFIDGITIDTIIQLVRLVLKNQSFIYNDNLYQQIHDGASGSPLTIPLVYIYPIYWRRDLINIFVNKHEAFGRFKDELLSILDLANTQFYQNIWGTTCIGTKNKFHGCYNRS